jgi:hypothetical protein
VLLSQDDSRVICDEGRSIMSNVWWIMKFEVFTAFRMCVVAFCYLILCNLVYGYQRWVKHTAYHFKADSNSESVTLLGGESDTYFYG